MDVHGIAGSRASVFHVRRRGGGQVESEAPAGMMSRIRRRPSPGISLRRPGRGSERRHLCDPESIEPPVPGCQAAGTACGPNTTGDWWASELRDRVAARAGDGRRAKPAAVEDDCGVMVDLLRTEGAHPPALRELLAGEGMVLAPGCYDALGARLVEEAGFPAVYMTGFGSAASRLGRPDVGLMGLSEMVDNARRIAQAVDIPVIADADTGYGNSVNIIRTVREFEAAGISAIHLEDQVMPKRCGHMEGKQVVSAEEAEAKIAAAVAARRSDEFVVIARTDARAVEGLAAAIERARRYRAAGADMLFLEAPQSTAEIEEIAEAFRDVPLLFNYAEGGKTPPVSHEFLRSLGFRLVIFPISTLLVATRAIRDVLSRIRADGTPIDVQPSLLGFGEFLDFIGLPEIHELDRRFAARGDQITREESRDE
jgi:carboxyvinyl-carboxyphosphonate phosphorylmutase